MAARTAKPKPDETETVIEKVGDICRACWPNGWPPGLRPGAWSSCCRNGCFGS